MAAPTTAAAGGVAPPPHSTPGYPPPVRAGTWGWQRWVLLAVGAIFLLSGLRQLGIIPGRADDPRSRAIIGRWAGTTACNGAMTFAADGSYTVHTGARARWRFNGDQLILSGDGAGQTWRLVSWTPDSITFLMGPTAMRYTMVRC